ncbi:uncharacterized protein LOC104584037 [Brachypodium distachyon]|uniref:Uncharacterized protein n=1 Tax=Brachypodium distachyon TaxID=15368 RepID=A0A0Q3HPA5_BRADI|nr:uncharacterized protein LOC104584037 [Brachypodium distachyon]KQJ95266.1 hypothetical protein BRADI_3g16135v3 [Brachypodium distachyon]|eukprot:XP_010236437.1 uncharacterized protein LOC104584037 [Brachypodium distachyon]
MARTTTTPTRRPACGAAAPPFFPRRVCSRPCPDGFNSLPSSSSSPVRLAPAALVSTHDRGGRAKRACMCSPTTHPGSFRCALHRGCSSSPGTAAAGGLHQDARRSAMANSLVRIAAVEGGDHVRRALAALVRPSSHHQRRGTSFRALPSRLSAMSAAAAVAEPPPSQ